MRSEFSILILGLGFPAIALSTAMIEPIRNSLAIRYDNGDAFEIACLRESPVCTLRIRVNEHSMEFTSADLGVKQIYADHAILYSGAGSGRDKYFSFDVSVACPVVPTTAPFYSCHANVLVEDHKITDVEVVRSVSDDLP